MILNTWFITFGTTQSKKVLPEYISYLLPPPFVRHFERMEVMLDAASVLRGENNCAPGAGFNAADAFSLMYTESNDMFREFMEEFTIGSWPLSENGSMPPMKRFTDLGHLGGQSNRRAGDTADNVISFVGSNDQVAVVEGYPCRGQKGHPKTKIEGARDLDFLRVSAEVSTKIDNDEANAPSRSGSCTAPSGSTARLTDFTPPSDKDENEAISERIISYTSVRRLSNTTYMRRMHLSKKEAINLFPEVQGNIETIFRIGERQRDKPGPFKMSVPVSLHDDEGRQWPVVLECQLTAGQRHVRLVKGWTELCSVKGFSVGKRIRLDRWEQRTSSRRSFVAVSIE
jgi:hypothetical protein